MKEKRNIYFFIIIFFILSCINLYNARFLNTFYKFYYIKQIIWYILGFLTIFIIKKINIKNIFKYSKYLYILNIILLILVLLLGDAINGTKAWLNIGIFTFQPSEFMKISLALFLIEITSKKEKKLIIIIKLFIYTLIPSILVFLEPDTGAIIFYLFILFSILLLLKIKWHYYLIIILLGISASMIFVYLYFNNQDLLVKILGTSIFYRIDRLINFRTNNYQLELALISIFASSVIRNGFGNILLYIPEGETDFIFAFAIGNFGLILIPIILISYFFTFINVLNLLKYSQNKKTNYLIISFFNMFFFQVIINIAMNIGLVPIIGITLPFLSYGGSSLLVYFIFLGIIFSLVNKVC